MYPLEFRAISGLWLFHRFKEKMPQFVVITQLRLMSKLKEVGTEQEGKTGWQGEC